MKEEVYCFKRRIEACLRKVRNSAVDEESKRKILEFYQECIVRGYSKARIIKYIILETKPSSQRFTSRAAG